MNDKALDVLRQQFLEDYAVLQDAGMMQRLRSKWPLGQGHAADMSNVMKIGGRIEVFGRLAQFIVAC